MIAPATVTGKYASRALSPPLLILPPSTMSLSGAEQGTFAADRKRAPRAPRRRRQVRAPRREARERRRGRPLARRAVRPPGSPSAAAKWLLHADLHQFAAHIERLRTAASSTAAREREECALDVDAARAACEQARTNIQALKDELAAAQQTRANRVAYDALARKILVYPARAALQEQIAERERHIAELTADSEALTSATASTTASLSEISASMHALHTTVKRHLDGAESGEAESGDAPAPKRARRGRRSDA